MKIDSLANKVYIELRKKILSNQLVSGTRLKEDIWAKRLDVNRMAVREALTRLLGEQLIETGEKGGYFVKSMSAEDVRQIRELREILELGAIRLAIQKIDEQGIQKLEEICNDFTSMVERGYFGGACEADVKFHETLIDCAQNEKLKDIYEISNIPLFHQKLGKSQTHMDDYELTDQEHRQILKALKEKDIKLAEETLSKHLLRGEVEALELD
ncbi:GntR family transcriptional regulator [Runella zeae]|uniref:GntR family transcriptional regulator n=1 Tax=Runella zeae TaxID=94255 RepID=UPI000415C555|nr:GntR family transcriptional regulator [Runella zeae]